MATEDTQKPAGDDPFSGWAEALDEQRERDAKLAAAAEGAQYAGDADPYKKDEDEADEDA